VAWNVHLREALEVFILMELVEILSDALLRRWLVLQEGGSADRAGESNMWDHSMAFDYCQGLLIVGIVRMRRAEVEWMEGVGGNLRVW